MAWLCRGAILRSLLDSEQGKTRNRMLFYTFVYVEAGISSRMTYKGRSKIK